MGVPNTAAENWSKTKLTNDEQLSLLIEGNFIAVITVGGRHFPCQRRCRCCHPGSRSNCNSPFRLWSLTG